MQCHQDYHISDLNGLGGGFLVPPELRSTMRLVPALESTCTGDWSSQVDSVSSSQDKTLLALH